MPFKILDKYLKVLPPQCGDDDVFYLKPLKDVPSVPDEPWFVNVPIGKNKLNGLLKEMCTKAGIYGAFTNHSLRAYGATTLFRSGVTEKLIQQRTGHRSVEALQQIERTSESQLVEISNIISGEQSNEKPIAIPPTEQTTPAANQPVSPSELPIVVSSTLIRRVPSAADPNSTHNCFKGV